MKVPARLRALRATLPPLTPAERREQRARRAFRRLEAGQGKRRILWQVRSKP
jgi:hypothetical protein